ncbi:MAG: hypothetical protein LLF94_02575 [Chlamydiales bacterium]|nr:hypothetical protein [Chlamydiales bacterium]
MADFGKISWGPKTSNQAPKNVTDTEKLFESFCALAQEKIPDAGLAAQFTALQQEMSQLQAGHEKFAHTMASTPFITSFMLWVRHGDSQNIDIAKALVQNDFIGTHDNSGNVWTMEMAKNFDHQKVLSAIRSTHDWTVRRRETAVTAYIDFINWLSTMTYGYIGQLQDQDPLAVKNRLLPFSKFLDFLDALPNEKSQLVAKLLYFGGDRTLDPVLNLAIESVNFDQLSISWNTLKKDAEITHYPEHVLSDIKALMGNRKQGKIFLGSQKQLLSDVTIFRHFSDASKKALGSSFGPKKLTTNKL